MAKVATEGLTLSGIETWESYSAAAACTQQTIERLAEGADE